MKHRTTSWRFQSRHKLASRERRLVDKALAIAARLDGNAAGAIFNLASGYEMSWANWRLAREERDPEETALAAEAVRKYGGGLRAVVSGRDPRLAHYEATGSPAFMGAS